MVNDILEYFNTDREYLKKLAYEIKEALYSYPHSAVVKGRLLAEYISKEIATLEGEDYLNSLTQVDRIKKLNEEGLIDFEIYKAFNSIRKLGNIAAHDEIEGELEAALSIHRNLHKIICWFIEVYVDPSFESIVYKTPNPMVNDNSNEKIEQMLGQLTQFMNSSITQSLNTVDVETNKNHVIEDLHSIKEKENDESSETDNYLTQEIEGLEEECINIETSKKCLINDLKRLKESSKEAVENLSSFSDFKSYMHVKRDVESELYSIIEKSSQSNRGELILVCGGVGDGKSHLISYFRNKYPDMMNKFNMHNDATESFEPGKTSIDTLNDVLDGFSDENIDTTSEKFILAINLGALSNFIDSRYGERFKKLKSYVEEKGILDVSISDSSYNEQSSIQFINFSDYHIYSLNDGVARSKYLDDIIKNITQEHKHNVFKNSYKNNCISCSVNYKCPIKANYEMLMKESVRESLISIVIESVVKDKLIVSTRSLLNFIYDFLVNTILDNKNDKELIEYIGKINCEEFIDCVFTSNLYDHKELSYILASISKIDPINAKSESLDNVIIKLNTTDDMTNVFNEYIEINNDSYLSTILNKNEEIQNVMNGQKNKCDKEKIQNKLIDMFIRLNLFISKKELDLKDTIYVNYMKNVYYFNKGEKKNLSSLYKNVKEASYRWNGDSEDGTINLSIGRNQIRYKMSQRLNIKPDLSNLKINDSNELFKFNPNLNLIYKSEEQGKSYGIDIDFNLYELLMRVKNGYRPNKNDKYNYINFVEFINKIQKLGNQNKEIYIEDRSGSKNLKYKLVYDEDFEEFKFYIN
ncbi:DNA phosphorothioation-dependent restriction protein DptF [Paraclostridium benzoelyticum]|uniref:DNA phosphorothioation-dependent restriction protein DptF n=1 Tax=Paraclostridium benzoelyticum TaxID=1629550 RepID=UPI0006994A0E|nr:DNA phosphorothioation-dependent restriction protein DptF [Paraclostridium benzoelyticum]